MIIRQWRGTDCEVFEIPGLAQEARPSSEWPYQPDWVVLEVHYDTIDRMLTLIGVNLNYPADDPNRNFFWRHYWLPVSNSHRPLDWRYDLLNCRYVVGRHETEAEARTRHFAAMRAERQVAQ